MLRIRYMIIDYSHETAIQLRCEGDTFINTPVPHHMMPVHHWMRLDASTVFLKGTYHNRHHKALMEMPGVTVLPPTHSRRKVSSAIDEQGNSHHHAVLKNHAMPYDPDDSTTSDLVDWASIHLHEIFDHEI